MDRPGRVKSRLLLFSLAIALGIGGLVAAQLLKSRAAVWQRAQAANTNLVFTVSQLLQYTMQGADHALQHTTDMLEHGPSSRHQLFFDSLLDDRYGIQLVLDEFGAVIAASRTPPGGGLNFAHRDYFTVHLQRPDVG